jgi:hypothetical protein
MNGSPLERLMEKVAWNGDGDECWTWEGSKTHGYGQLCVGGKTRRVHRLSYEEFIGPIPDGLHLDHLCRNRACVNPSHLEPVTNRENVLRGIGPTAKLAARKVCKRGHPLDGANLIVRKDGKGRECRACRDYHESRRPKRSWKKVPAHV